MKVNYIIVLILISLLFFTVRIYKVENYPHYDNDESFYHQLSLNIKQGKFIESDNHRYYVDIYGLKYTPHEHPPLHFLLTLPFLNEYIVSIRLINIFWNFVIMILIFMILQKIINTQTGLLGAFIWSIYPYAIYMNRLNYPQTSLALFTLCFILSVLYNSPNLSMLSIIAATLSQYCGILLVIPFIIKYKYKAIEPLIWGAILGLAYTYWVVDRYVIQQMIPTLKRFVYLWEIAIIGILLFVIVWMIIHYIDWCSLWKKFCLWFTNNQILWIGLFFYLLVVYIVIKPVNLYSWYTYGINVFYIGVVGLFMIKNKTMIWCYFLLQAFMLILNRGDHIAVMVQPLIIIGFTIIVYNIISIYQKKYQRKCICVALILISIIGLYKVYAYMPQDTEDLDAFDKVVNYTNSIITNTTCVMSMTKFSTRLNTECKSDILLPIAYEHGDAVYRHFYDRSIFNRNISYKNMEYVIVKESGLEFLKNWGKNQNKSLFVAINEIMSWRNITIGNLTIFINPITNLTYGKMGYDRIYYHEKPDKEGLAIANILTWNSTNVSGYTIRKNPTIKSPATIV